MSAPRRPPRPALTGRADRDLSDLEGLAWLLDRSVPLPGTRRRFGVDAVVGLIPVAGDVLTGSVGVYLIVRALQFRLPPVVIVRMVFNTLLDLTVGIIPVVGDVFDFMYQSNSRNIALLRTYALEPGRSTREHRMFLAGVALVVIGVLGLLLYLGAWLIGAIGRALGGT